VPFAVYLFGALQGDGGLGRVAPFSIVGQASSVGSAGVMEWWSIGALKWTETVDIDESDRIYASDNPDHS